MNSIRKSLIRGAAGMAVTMMPAMLFAQADADSAGAPPELTVRELAFMLRQQEQRFSDRFEQQEKALASQQKLIDGQQAALAAQEATIKSLQERFASAGTATSRAQSPGAEQRRELESQRQALATQTAAIQSLQAQVDQLNRSQQQAVSDNDRQLRARLETLEGTVSRFETEETTTRYDAKEFPGAFPVPGTPAAIRIGGFVKADLIQNVNGVVGEQDSFIVGTIPTTGQQSGDEEANVTVSQSRINLEYRQNTKRGQLRAFIEGDFAGTDSNGDDTFRLRHAFGQFGDFLAGQYWTNFMDVDAAPEEIDFEGINGRINVRQPQLRYFPEFGGGWNLILSLEDPNPEITGGDGISKIPDFVASIRRTVRDKWNVKASVLARSLEARWDVDDNVKDDQLGWGVSVSGKRSINWWDPRDNVSLQLSYGEGYARYVNDLNTIGGQDGFFDANGNLKLLPVFATYLSGQKWWRDGLRSTSTISFVDINNQSGQPDDAYARTWRWSTNLIWSPVPAIDIGGEFLMGGREDKDGTQGEAKQVQIAARYRF